MSSLAAHALAGVTVYLCSVGRTPRGWRSAAALVCLAVCPDLDYLGVWLLGYAATPRVTHSLLFAVAAAMLVQRIARAGGTGLPLRWLLVASVSHPVLDLLVGAHPVPLWWPLQAAMAVPGVLPSAGALRLDNLYLWRNLLIELGVLLPVSAALVAIAHGSWGRRWRAWAVWMAPLWALFVVWSVSLSR